MIIVNDIHKRYWSDCGIGRWMLRGVSFTILPKVSVGLVGRNGACKQGSLTGLQNAKFVCLLAAIISDHKG